MLLEDCRKFLGPGMLIANPFFYAIHSCDSKLWYTFEICTLDVYIGQTCFARMLRKNKAQKEITF